MFNAERVLLTSPKAIGEVLSQKTYDFVKPSFLRAGIAQILGVGILLAEGEEHKVRAMVGLKKCTIIDIALAATEESNASV